MSFEWNVIVLSPHSASALLVRDLGDTGPDSQRRFAYVLTHDRPTVEHAAAEFLRRAT